MFFCLLACKSAFRVFFEQFFEEIYDKRRKESKIRMRKIRFKSENIVYGLWTVLSLERSKTYDEFIESDSNCPAIDFLAISITQKHLRRLVVVRPRIRKHKFIPSSECHHFADPKIYNLNAICLLIIENIPRLDIAMTDMSLVHIGKCFQ